MKKTNTPFVSFIWCCILFLISSAPALSFEASPVRITPVSDPPEIILDGQVQFHLLVPEASEQRLIVQNLLPGETYALEMPAPAAWADCMPSIRLKDGIDDGGAVTFKATGPTMEFLLRFPCVVGSPGTPGRYALTLQCATCPKKAVDGEPESGSALLQVTPDVDKDSVIQHVFIGNSCFDVQNVTFSGEPFQLGTFSNGSTNIGMESGMIISTMPVIKAIGPNNRMNAEFPQSHAANGTNFDADLSPLPGVNGLDFWDLVSLEFDFVPTEDVISFEYVFATEEYCDYVGTAYNDVFGFFIEGPGIPGGKQNLAVVPGDTLPVSVNTINHKMNSSFYVHNIGANLGYDCSVENNGDPVPYANGPAIDELQYNGFTTVLTATANVIPCETYHIKLKIANVSDWWKDAAVFFKARSFDGGGAAVPEWLVNNQPDPGATNEGCDTVQLVFQRVGGDLTDSVSIDLLISGTATPGVDYGAIPNPVIIPKDSAQVIIDVPVFNDFEVEGDETIEVRLVDSCNCSDPFRTLLIHDVTPGISGAPDFICPGDMADISVSGYDSYLWAPGGETDSMITVSGPGVYTVTVTNNAGCTAVNFVDISALGFVVTTVADDGPGSFRQTLECANLNPGPDTITFNIPGGGPFDIVLQAELPPIQESVYIDVTTQPGWNMGDVRIKPENPDSVLSGLLFEAGVCRIIGLGVSGFSNGDGIASVGPGDVNIENCLIDSCDIGVNLYTGLYFVLRNNTIHHNTTNGVEASSTLYTQLRENSFYCNGGDPFVPASNAPATPVIVSATPTVISGTANYVPSAGNQVEVFVAGDTACPSAEVQGRIYLGSAIVNPDSSWSLSGSFSSGGKITSTHTYVLFPSKPPSGKSENGKSESTGLITEKSSTSDFSPVTCISYVDSVSSTICAGETYEVGGMPFDSTDFYAIVLTALDGCDSTIYLDLTVLDSVITVLTESICSGDSYSVGDSTFNATGNFAIPLVAADGCDSTVYLALTVLDTVATILTETICTGDSYGVGDSIYSVSGNFEVVLTAANGCDSTVYLALTVLDTVATFLNPTICAGEVVDVGGMQFDATGYYPVVLTAQNGCDSTVYLDLTVLDTAATFLNPTICAGEVVDVGGMQFDATGYFPVVLTAQNGCDSTVYLDLTVL
ncbi:MAG: hypothetical protein EP344_01135, partial [Bacteroidetes bacterium]